MQGTAQVFFQGHSLHHHRLHAGVEKACGVFARAFGLVHGQVGVFHQVFCTGFLFTEQGHADAARVVDVVACQRVGVAQYGEHFLCHRLHMAGRFLLDGAQVFQHDHKLIAAQPGHGVALAHGVLQPPGDLLQQHVAAMVAQCVVDKFEVVQVDEDHRTVVACACAAAQSLLQPVEQQAAVGQTGEAIVKRQLPDGFFIGLAL